MAGALLLVHLAPADAFLPRRVREMLDLPFELAHALERGCETQGLGNLAALPEAIWHHRGGSGAVAD
eukprot:14621238-Alexandrium_andersonii.AAC.1